MRILIVGAGAIGGYFGGRLLQAGADVTFLVRPHRNDELTRDGLVIQSPNGDATLRGVQTVQADSLREPFDVVLLSCKAFDLNDAIASFAPAVGGNTAIIPMLNGMKHLDGLDAKFGRERVLGGQCQIAAMLNERREIVQLTPMQSLGFGERDGTMSDRVTNIARIFGKGNFGAAASAPLRHGKWGKRILLANLAGVTSAMRAPVGVVVASPGGRDFMLGVRDEISAIAVAEGYAPRAAFLERTQAMLTAEGSPLTASMFRDIRAGAPIEADQIVGDLIARADAAKSPVPRLRTIYTHLKAYEATRAAA